MAISYKTNIVAFIDVLGFKEIVLSSDKTLLEIYFSTIETQLKELSKNSKLKYILISDTIILIAENKLESFLKLLTAIQYLQALLLSEGIIVRGSITVDSIYLNKNKNIIVGPALVNAYYLEGLAKFPRIIIDRKLIDNFSFENSASLLEYANSQPLNTRRPNYLLQNDNDNFIYINYISRFIDRRKNFTKEHIEVVYVLIKKNFNTNKNLEKYDWLKSKFIVELKLIQSKLDSITIKPRNNRHLNSKRVGSSKWLTKFERL